MPISTLLGLGIEFAGLGTLIFLLLLTGYFVVYRKFLKGTKRLPVKHLLWWGLFFCYCFVVLGVTILFRASSLLPEPIHGLFYSYRDAWAHWSLVSWRNIILNFCMFMPLGFMLPLGTPFFRHGLATGLAGFLFSLFIELIQLITRRGMFEPDDLLGNTVGTLIGYGLYLLGCCFLRILRRKKPYRPGKTLLAQLPLLLTVFVFGCIFLRYQSLELGINPSTYIVPYSSKRFSLKSDYPFSAEKGSGCVYKTKYLSLTEEKALAKEIFEDLGVHLREDLIDIYDNTTFFHTMEGRYALWVDHKGGTYQLTDYQTIFSHEEPAPQPVEGASEEELRNALTRWKLTSQAMVSGISFEEKENGWYKFTLPSPIPVPSSGNQGEAAMAEADRHYAIGALSCQYYGEGKIGQLKNQLIDCKKGKEYPLLSEQEAYEELKKGRFYYPDTPFLDIYIADCKLIFLMDSKGYLQPSYEFTGTINGEDGYLRIPALRRN